MMSVAAREANAVTAITAREIILALKSPFMLGFNIVFPMIFIGILGGGMAQNLASDLPFNFMQFILIGMIVMTIFTGTISGISQLIEERNENFTQELFVAPISRYAIILGKIIGSSITSLIGLLGILIIAFILQIPLGGMSIVWLILVTPVFCLVGASLGIFFISFVNDSKVADIGSMLLVMPQMFLSGAIIPINNSSGILDFLAHIMPMTYCIDLARAVFYAGQPEYDQIVLYSPWLNLTVLAGFFLVFSIVGTIMFTRSERNR